MQDTELDNISKQINLPAPLRSYQWEGVRFLLESDSALLADQMGLGKTVQVAVALSLLLPKYKLGRALIIVPASLRINWKRELESWANNLSVRALTGNYQERHAQYLLPTNVLIGSYEQIREDYLTLSDLVNFDVVILDEAQRIKNSGTETALACRILSRNHAWALTGTPIENRVRDLVSIFRFVAPTLLKISMTRVEMHKQMKPFFLRRLKEEVLPELPEIIMQDIPMELNDLQRIKYDSIWNKRRKNLGSNKKNVSNTALFALITKLKQICNFDKESNESSKLDALKIIIDSLSSAEDKVVVFSQYVETLKWIAEHINKEVPYDMYHGGLNENEKESAISSFKIESGPRILLMSLKAGGIGLNLQEANYVVLYDRWWNPAIEDQAIHRAHRFGRKNVLHVFRFVVINSIEEKILGNTQHTMLALLKRIVTLFLQIKDISKYQEGRVVWGNVTFGMQKGKITKHLLRRYLIM